MHPKRAVSEPDHRHASRARHRQPGQPISHLRPIDDPHIVRSGDRAALRLVREIAGIGHVRLITMPFSPGKPGSVSGSGDLRRLAGRSFPGLHPRMQQLAPAYLTTLATQIGALSAFLGGFAATYLATFLTFGQRSRPASVAIGGAVTSAVGFIV